MKTGRDWRDAWGHQKLDAAGRTLLWSRRGSTALPTPWRFQTSGLQSCERLGFCSVSSVVCGPLLPWPRALALGS